MPRRKKLDPTVEKRDVTCCRCGSSNQHNFYKSRDEGRQIFGTTLYCKNCVNDIYEYYFSKHKTMNLGVYYTCRKIDVPYNHKCYSGALNTVENKNATMFGNENIMRAYMKTYGSFSERNGWGESFDDSQGDSDIDGLSSFADVLKVKRRAILTNGRENEDKYEMIEYDTEELINKWGLFEADDLCWLESEYLDWSEKLGGITDKTSDMLVREVCKTYREIMNEREREGGDADKKIKILHTLLKESGLSTSDNTVVENSVGMAIKEIEFRKPIPEPDEDLKDIDKINDILIGFLGTMCRVLGKENVYTEKFDEVYSKYTIKTIQDLEKQRLEELKEIGGSGGESTPEANSKKEKNK